MIGLGRCGGFFFWNRGLNGVGRARSVGRRPLRSRPALRKKRNTEGGTVLKVGTAPEVALLRGDLEVGSVVEVGLVVEVGDALEAGAGETSGGRGRWKPLRSGRLQVGKAFDVGAGRRVKPRRSGSFCDGRRSG